MGEWKEYKLGEIAEFRNGKSRPDADGDVPIYGGNGILGYTNQHNSEGEAAIIGRVGAYCGSVYFENGPIWVSDNALFALPKHSCDTKFLYYFLKNMNLNSFAEGSSHPLLTQTLLNSIDVLVTDDSHEQRAIASVLSSLDDKIDLLHRQNKTLEAMAETLFRQWFVEEAKEEWNVIRVCDLTKNIQYGLTTSASDVRVGPKFLRITDIQGGRIEWETVPYCKVTSDEYEKYKLSEGDIVVARTGASTGENCYILDTSDAVFASYLVRFQFENPVVARYVATFMRTEGYFEYVAGSLGGSAQPNASAKVLSEAELRMPPIKMLEQYFAQASQFDQKLKYNNQHVRLLTRLRDALLPKLMSGEVRVKE